MHFQPIDEMALRHLFSSGFGEEILKMKYIGPVLNQANIPETSPDAFILDKRGANWRLLKCEFKYFPVGKKDFEHNGKFDIAVIWDIYQGITKDKLLVDLFDQNGCTEIFVLKDIKAFRDLPVYNKLPSLKDLEMMEDLSNVILRLEFPVVFCAYIAVKIFPKTFHIEKMKQVLMKRFPSVVNMKAQGRGNVVSALVQTKPPLIKKMHGYNYRWTDEINPILAERKIGELILSRFQKDLPDNEIIDSFKQEFGIEWT